LPITIRSIHGTSVARFLGSARPILALTFQYRWVYIGCEKNHSAYVASGSRGMEQLSVVRRQSSAFWLSSESLTQFKHGQIARLSLFLRFLCSSPGGDLTERTASPSILEGGAFPWHTKPLPVRSAVGTSSSLRRSRAFTPRKGFRIRSGASHAAPPAKDEIPGVRGETMGGGLVEAAGTTGGEHKSTAGRVH